MAVLIEKKDNIVMITINRPEALNAINRNVMKDLNTFFTDTYKTFGDFVGVIITGSGEKAFAAGADIKEFTTLSQEETTEMSRFGHDTYFAIERFHVPVIALVKGFALGGGCELAMACHMRIATDNARFGQPEVNLGLLPGYGGSQRLVQHIGLSRAIEFLLTADMIKADKAYELGLVNYICAPNDALNKAIEILTKIGTKGPLAVSKTISAVYEGLYDLESGYAYEAKSFGEVMISDEAKEGIDAFLNKRKANFKK